ncbi:hypothetical protein HBI38_088650 [Parastagonospora nodorum]|nr:hypothetical protein HBH50_156500 [Parastagonospora nodorum]KAH4087547.1 hypothetical protein HBH48_133690 [Parastagonospora nodorum]KAH5541353.1 hypothetical protein HBI27_089900 [Parastagonospora nodorum]KAH5679237.1 hypothetical protein HBI21_081610 [Parastagonospora nodorum]KAH6047309.1 hypothetical protein HBI54_075730 [Parastagonospora nodorum]
MLRRREHGSASLLLQCSERHRGSPLPGSNMSRPKAELTLARMATSEVSTYTQAANRPPAAPHAASKQPLLDSINPFLSALSLLEGLLPLFRYIMHAQGVHIHALVLHHAHLMQAPHKWRYASQFHPNASSHHGPQHFRGRIRSPCGARYFS